jgi:Alpha-L-arabinofuranosidase C-terminal domain
VLDSRLQDTDRRRIQPLCCSVCLTARSAARPDAVGQCQRQGWSGPDPLTNLEAEAPQPVEIDLRGGGFEVAQAPILTSPQLTDRNTPEQLDTVSPQTFDQVTHTGQSLLVELPRTPSSPRARSLSGREMTPRSSTAAPTRATKPTRGHCHQATPRVGAMPRSYWPTISFSDH